MSKTHFVIETCEKCGKPVTCECEVSGPPPWYFVGECNECGTELTVEVEELEKSR